MEIKSFTGLRGLASLYVVVFHYIILVYTKYHNFDSLTGHVHSSAVVRFILHGYLAVDVFFMLSAFVISLSSEKLFAGHFSWSNYKHFMLKRWTRIYPSFIIILLFGFAIHWKFEHVKAFLLSSTLLTGLTHVQYVYANHWSLSAEWIAYLVFPVLFKLSRFSAAAVWNYILILTGVTGLLMISYFLSVDVDRRIDITSGIPSLIRCFLAYIMGIGGYNLFKDGKLNYLTTNNASGIIFAMTVLSLFINQIDVVTVFLSLLLILSIAKDNNLSANVMAAKPVYFLGTISYPLYLIHYPVCLFFGKPSMASFTLYLTVSLSAATIFTYYVEAPVIKRLKLLTKTKGTA